MRVISTIASVAAVFGRPDGAERDALPLTPNNGTKDAAPANATATTTANVTTSGEGPLQTLLSRNLNGGHHHKKHHAEKDRGDHKNLGNVKAEGGMCVVGSTCSSDSDCDDGCTCQWGNTCLK